MKAAVLIQPRHIEIQDLPVPHAGAGEVVVRVGACGVCGTDQHIFEGGGHLTLNFPLVPGHEMAGEVVEAGAGVTHVRVGDMVAMDPNIACGVCFWCRRGEVNLCANMEALGVTRAGGFEEYCLAPAKQALRLPDGLNPVAGGLAEPVACCLRGADRVAVRPGETVAILGGGFIGLVLLQLFKAAGAGTVVVSEPSAARRRWAKRLGADAAVDPTTEDLPAAVLEATHGIGVDAAIESAGRTQTAEQCVQIARKGGRVLFFGVAPQEAEARIRPFDIYRKELSVLGSFVNPFTHVRALDLLARGVVQVQPLISHRFPVEEFALALETAKSPEAVKVVVTP